MIKQNQTISFYADVIAMNNPLTMRNRSGLKLSIFSLLFILFLNTLGSQETKTNLISRYFDWPSNSFQIELSQNIVRNTPLNRLSAVSKSQPVLEEYLIANFPDSIKNLLIDSKTSISDYLAVQASLPSQLQSFARQLAKIVHAPSKDLRGTTLRANIPIFPEIASLFVQHDQTITLDRVYSWQPKTEYTGLIIYMAEALPWFGLDGKTLAQAALFPKLLDLKNRLLLDLEYIEPAFAKRWGTAGYAESINEAQKNIERIGDNPYIITAHAVFGIQAVDPMISQNDADLLLYSQTSRKALSEGRIIIVLSKDALRKNW